MKRPTALLVPTLLLLTASLCALGGAGCDDDEDEEEAPPAAAAATAGATTLPGETAATPGDPNGEMVTLTDPTEQAFTVDMPKGWLNQAYLVRYYDQYRSVGTSLSPDGETLIFIGDPELPAFGEPNEILREDDPIANANKLFKIARFQQAVDFLPGYVKKKFGGLPDFNITEVRPSNPGLEKLTHDAMERNGIADAKVTTALLTFDYTDNGKPMHAVVNGATFGIGTIWMVDISGVSTTGDPVAYNDLLFRIGGSYRATPEWKEKERQMQEQRMAQMKRDHANNMAAIQASAQRHQMRMKALHDASDARMKSWYDRQAASDDSHRRFLNYITDENTVVSQSSGKAWQVETGHDRYYMHKRDDTKFVGADSTTDLDDLRKRGLNPDDYEEVRIKR